MDEKITITLPATIARRIKDRAIMEGDTPENVAADLVRAGLGDKAYIRKGQGERTASEKQLTLLRWSIQAELAKRAG